MDASVASEVAPSLDEAPTSLGETKLINLARISHTGWGFEGQLGHLHADIVSMKIRNLRGSRRTQ